MTAVADRRVRGVVKTTGQEVRSATFTLTASLTEPVNRDVHTWRTTVEFVRMVGSKRRTWKLTFNFSVPHGSGLDEWHRLAMTEVKTTAVTWSLLNQGNFNAQITEWELLS